MHRSRIGVTVFLFYATGKKKVPPTHTQTFTENAYNLNLIKIDLINQFTSNTQEIIRN